MRHFLFLALLLSLAACSDGNHPLEPQFIATPTLDQYLGGTWQTWEAGMVQDRYTFNPANLQFCHQHPGQDTLQPDCEWSYTLRLRSTPERPDTLDMMRSTLELMTWCVLYHGPDQMTVAPDGGHGFPFVLYRLP